MHTYFIEIEKVRATRRKRLNLKERYDTQDSHRMWK